ncbi:MAG: hypothetical protein GY760_23105 [Deltaproteobacteria bacterium]|nr:hypothetical protein [Deltaproteobacteria bacterium]
MKIELKELFCMEWELGKEIVLDKDHSFSVSAYIGPSNSNISECFTVSICNIDYLETQLESNIVFNGLWHLILINPDEDIIKNYFKDKINNPKGETWESCIKELILIGESEFEDYQD